MTILSQITNTMANAPSTQAATDRATTTVTRTPTLRPSTNNKNNNDTSSFDSSSPRILACSYRPTKEVQSLQAKLLKARKRNEYLEEIERGVDADGYPLCQYRKGFWEHLKIKALVLSTVRVSIQQAATILISFISEQLELDLKRNVKVNEGQMTQLEADLEAEEWEKVEWDKRWKTFPLKFVHALIKYQAVTLILRSYELVASKIVNLKQLDKLTTDPFAISRRLATKLSEQKSSPRNKKNNTAPTNESLHVTISMTQTTLWANFLPFCADYSLYQGLLCYGYYKYYTLRRQRRLLELAQTSPSDPDEQDSIYERERTVSLEERTALVKDLTEKSTRLASNRGLGWFCSSVGAGVGSVVWPGWGTLVVSAMGDAAAGMVLDDGYHRAQTSLEERTAEEKGGKASIALQ